MQCERRRWRLSFLALPAAVLTAMTPAPAQAACDFPTVKNQIDAVLDRDAVRGEKFRREVASGAELHRHAGVAGRAGDGEEDRHLPVRNRRVSDEARVPAVSLTVRYDEFAKQVLKVMNENI